MSCPVVEVRNLTKYFLPVRPLPQVLRAPFARPAKFFALRGVSFAVPAGEILGIVGPNGAGKTTLLRLLADLLEADAGSVRLGGYELATLGPRARRDIGYVSNDERSFFWRLTGVQNLEFFGRLYGLPRVRVRQRMEELLAWSALEDKARHLFRDYSSGTRKKFALVRALLHEPKLVLLDEATNSLDPPSARSVKALVRDYVSAGSERAAVWSTHRLEEIGEICDRVLVINYGRAEFLGSAKDSGSLRLVCN